MFDIRVRVQVRTVSTKTFIAHFYPKYYGFTQSISDVINSLMKSFYIQFLLIIEYSLVITVLLRTIC